MNVSDNLEVYYAQSRGVGHTELLKKGIENYDKKFFLVAGSYQQGKNLVSEIKNPNAILITLDDIGSYKLRGLRYPIAFDNFAMIKLIERNNCVIENLYIKNAKLLAEIKDLNEIVYELQDKLDWRKKFVSWVKSLFGR